jgi:hypothetical protein
LFSAATERSAPSQLSHHSRARRRRVACAPYASLRRRARQAEPASLGSFEDSRSLYQQAEEVSERKPNLMSERIVRKLAPLFRKSVRT